MPHRALTLRDQIPARAADVRIAAIIETHIHADFVSGSHELAARTGAPIYGGRSEDYRFDIRPLDDGAEIELGSVRLRALRTPGHTPEHTALLLFDDQQGKEPFGLFRLPDRIEVYPGHGAGSACGGSIGDRLQSTLGNERLFSPALKDRTQELFTDWLLGSLSDPPRYYAYLKKVNATGAPLRGATPLPAARNVDEFASLATERETVVIDTRGMEAWAAGHVQGALNLPADEHFPMWLGSVVDPEAQILLIAEDQHALADVVAHAYRIGYDHLLGYLHGGMAAWEQAGREVTHSELISVHQLAARLGSEDLTVLDVRTNGERAGGYIPGSLHIPANQIARRAGELDPSMPVVTYCGTGYRATVAASLLRRAGLEQAWAVPGSYRAWTAAGLEVAHDASDGAIQSAPQEVERTHQPGGIRR